MDLNLHKKTIAEFDLSRSLSGHKSPKPGTVRQTFPGWRIEAARAAALEDCSLVIATYERPGQVVQLLKTLADLSDCPAEVIVVDGSRVKDSERALLTEIAPETLPFELVYVNSPAGLTKQRNVGIDLSSRKHVYFLDDDCLPEPGYFRAIRKVFQADEAGRIGAVCGLVVNEMNYPVTRRWRMRFALGLVPRVKPGSYCSSGTCVPRNPVEPFSGIRPVDNLHGCSMAFRRAVLDRHRFSEFFQGYSQGEDLEMSLRIGNEWRIVWCGDAHVGHFHAASGRPTSFRKGKMEVRNRHFIWKRHSLDASFKDRLRFWLDTAFLATTDLGWFAMHPAQTHALAHAAGVLSGAIGCVFAPPRYEEPPARKQYDLYLAASALKSAT
jgi:GT2 family glycosyltransferase